MQIDIEHILACKGVFSWMNDESSIVLYINWLWKNSGEFEICYIFN